ncbi:MAG: hypothetical protein WCJ81_08550 [bacterium]
MNTLNSGNIKDVVTSGCVLWVPALEKNIFVVHDVKIKEKRVLSTNIYTYAEREFSYDEILLSQIEVMTHTQFKSIIEERKKGLKAEKAKKQQELDAIDVEINSINMFSRRSDGYEQNQKHIAPSKSN